MLINRTAVLDTFIQGLSGGIRYGKKTEIFTVSLQFAIIPVGFTLIFGIIFPRFYTICGITL
jgi:hypothetical protein